MLAFLSLLLVCQLAGETIALAGGLPVPGPVIGMAILFAGLMIRGGVGAELDRLSDTLLRNLALLFVPAGVGVVLHADLIAREWLPISAALVLGTVVTIAVTGLIMQLGVRRGADEGGRAP